MSLIGWLGWKHHLDAKTPTGTIEIVIVIVVVGVWGLAHHSCEILNNVITPLSDQTVSGWQVSVARTSPQGSWSTGSDPAGAGTRP